MLVLWYSNNNKYLSFERLVNRQKAVTGSNAAPGKTFEFIFLDTK